MSRPAARPRGEREPSNRAPSNREPSDRRQGSDLVHWIDSVLSRPLLALVIVGADLVWVACSAALDFPARLDAIFQTLVAAVTLAMVFVIQHTQSREELVTQRKLDEILHALPHADNAMIAFEEASDDELTQTHQAHRQRRRQAVGPGRDQQRQ